MTKDEITGHAEVCAGLADAIQRGENIDRTVLFAALTDAAAIIRYLFGKFDILPRLKAGDSSSANHAKHD